jgi:hypothetical protein
MAAYRAATGQEMDDNTPEYPSMNLVFGLLLLASVFVTTIRPVGGDPLRPFLPIAFWTVFGVFTLIRRGDSSGLDPVSWLWVDVTMVPAALMAGACLTRLTGLRRLALWIAIVAAASCAGGTAVAATLR